MLKFDLNKSRNFKLWLEYVAIAKSLGLAGYSPVNAHTLEGAYEFDFKYSTYRGIVQLITEGNGIVRFSYQK